MKNRLINMYIEQSIVNLLAECVCRPLESSHLCFHKRKQTKAVNICSYMQSVYRKRLCHLL